MKSLSQLHLNGNTLGNPGAFLLVEALSVSTGSLRAGYISIYSNAIEDRARISELMQKADLLFYF